MSINRPNVYVNTFSKMFSFLGIWRVRFNILSNKENDILPTHWITCRSIAGLINLISVISGPMLVRDSSAVWRLLWICCSRGTSESYAYGKQRICFSNSGLSHFHVSWLSDFYPSCHQKVVLHFITAQVCLRSYDSAICLPFFKYLSRDYEKTTITAMYHGRWFAYKQTNTYFYCQSYTPVKAEQLT